MAKVGNRKVETTVSKLVGQSLSINRDHFEIGELLLTFTVSNRIVYRKKNETM